MKAARRREQHGRGSGGALLLLCCACSRKTLCFKKKGSTLEFHSSSSSRGSAGCEGGRVAGRAPVVCVRRVCDNTFRTPVLSSPHTHQLERDTGMRYPPTPFDVCGKNRDLPGKRRDVRKFARAPRRHHERRHVLTLTPELCKQTRTAVFGL